jgi:phosphoglycolate phosphatase
MPDASEIRILEHICADLSRQKQDRAMVVGINGVDTSGKTTFTLSLADYLRDHGHRTQVVHLDDFHNSRAVRSQGTDERDAYITHAFNLDLLVTELLEPASKSVIVDKHLTLLNLDSDTYTNVQYYRIDTHTIVLVDGVLLYREPLDAYFDYRIFLRIGFAEVLRRARIRDVPIHGEAFLELYRRKYIPIQEWYLKTYTPDQRADIVIDNTDPEHPLMLLPANQ